MPKPAATPVSKADRRAALAGLDSTGRKSVARLLAEYDGWDPASLHTLRAYGLSCDRLALLTEDAERRAELRINLALLRSLHLESPR